MIAVDLAGHGNSTSDRATWTMREFARDIAAVTDAESVERAAVVGHSLGGAVAVELARLHPDLVTQVIGLDSFHYLGLYPLVEHTAARALLDTFEDFPAGVHALVAMGSVLDTDPGFGEAIFRKMSGIAPPVGRGALADTERPCPGRASPRRGARPRTTSRGLVRAAEHRSDSRARMSLEDGPCGHRRRLTNQWWA